MQTEKAALAPRNRSDFLVVTVRGTPFEMGVQYGEKANHVVSHSADYWFSQLAGVSERSKSDMLDVVSKSADASEKFFPELIEEVKGVAKGSGLKYEDVLLATFNNAVGGKRMGAAVGCSNFAAFGAATVDSEPILGRNLDYDYAVRTHGVIVRAVPKDGNSWLGGRSGAIIGLSEGINSKGVGGGWASVMQMPDQQADGMSFFQALEAALLKADTAEEAARIVAMMPKCTGGNYTFCDRNNAVVLEGGSKGSQLRHEKDGLVLGTNHWRTDEMVARQGMNKMDVPGSVFCPRFVYGERYLTSKRGNLSHQDFREMLSSHGTPPMMTMGMTTTGICAHNGPFSGTVLSSVSLPTKGLIYYARGHGCSNTYEEIKLAA